MWPEVNILFDIDIVLLLDGFFDTGLVVLENNSTAHNKFQALPFKVSYNSIVTNGKLTIDADAPVNLNLYSITGAAVLNRKVEKHGEFDISSFAPGEYII